MLGRWGDLAPMPTERAWCAGCSMCATGCHILSTLWYLRESLCFPRSVELALPEVFTMQLKERKNETQKGRQENKGPLLENLATDSITQIYMLCSDIIYTINYIFIE